MSKPLSNLPFPALAGVLGAVSPESFFEESWEKAPRFVSARSETDRESFRRADWRDLARAAHALKASSVEVIQGGRPVTAASDDAISEGFDAGASVRVIGVQTVWPFLDEFCASLRQELGFRIGGNMYVTPEGRQGLDIHADSHDVIVVQMAGGKDWEVFGSPYPLPVEFRAPMVFEQAGRRDHRGDVFGGRGYKGHEIGPPLLSCTLRAGDLLYVPRGFVHQAVASHGTSAHVTIGIHATTWGDLLALAAAQESRMETSLRETLPPGVTRVAASREFVQQELQRRGGRLFERMHGEALMIETASRFWAAGSAAGPQAGESDTDHAAEPSTVPSADAGPSAPLDSDTNVYRLTPEAHISFRESSVDIRSLKRGAHHSFPPAFTPLFEALAQGRPLRPGDAPPLTPKSGNAFAAFLVREGLLAPAD